MMWFNKWFNEDYLKLYAHRSDEEAAEQVKFITDTLGLQRTERVLDLACGTGRHSLAFALSGYSVLGVDLSPTLIEEARRRLHDHEGISASFYVADMFNLPQIGSFDLIVNLFTSFGYFADNEKNEEMFQVVKDHLKPEGQFFLDYLHPFNVKQTLVKEEVLEVEGERVVVTRSLEKDCVVKIIQFPGRTYKESVKLYEREQIEQMMHRHGLIINNVWNDYQGNPWKINGDRQLFLCSLK
jgi:SAM-dependent methyltransferase